VLERGVEEEVGIVSEGDVLGLLDVGALKDAELDNGRRVNRTAVGRCYNLRGIWSALREHGRLGRERKG
jgi:hypothetical protein